jgi:hypothetical protein
MNQTWSNLFRSSVASFIASRVFPDPPAPVRVTNRFSSINCLIVEISCSLPMNVLNGVGKLFKRGEVVPSIIRTACKISIHSSKVKLHGLLEMNLSYHKKQPSAVSNKKADG